MPVACGLRPVSSEARVGEQIAVVWNRLERSPSWASAASAGVATGPPKVEAAPKPTSASGQVLRIRLSNCNAITVRAFVSARASTSALNSCCFSARRSEMFCARVSVTRW